MLREHGWYRRPPRIPVREITVRGSVRPMNRGRFALLALVPMFLAVPAFTQDSAENENERVKGAHENLPADSLKDDLGITVPVPASHPGRRYPADHDFPTRSGRRRAPARVRAAEPGRRLGRLSCPSGRLEGRRRLLSVSRLVTVLPHAVGRAAREHLALRRRGHQGLRRQLRLTEAPEGLRRGAGHHL